MFFLIFIQLLISSELDTTKTYNLEEIEVESHHHIDANENHLKKVLNSTDDLLNRSTQITMLRRANFALEPTIRGLSNDRTNITIDGMHLFGACVDRMDPATNYIEIQNLESVDVCTPQNNCGCGGNNTINFKQEKANFKDNFSINYNSYFASASNNFINGIKSKYSKDNYSTSTNFIYKAADDFRSGGNNLINNSGYNKYNFTNDNHLKINKNHIVASSFMADVSTDVGYPALIMDTRKTETFLFAIKHNYTELKKNFIKLENKLYINSVWHLMDDYSRSVDEIKNRTVMPNMYMPMKGKTLTFGIINNYELLNDNYSIKIYNDLYNLFSSASMDMIPLENSNIMRLKNIAEANIISNKITINYNYYKLKSLEIGASAGLNFQYADLLDDENKKSFLLFADTKNSKNISFAPFIQSFISKKFNNTKLQLSTAYFVRNPNRFELFSYYVYNPLDDSFYTGNPELKNEKYFNIELGLTHKIKKYTATLNIFNNEFYNYIAGVKSENQYQNENFPQLFRQYKNTGRANIWGIEYISNLALNDNILIDLSFRYNRAYSISLQDNLPLISPFTTNLFLTYQKNKFRSVFDIAYNSRQSHTSKLFFNENQTEAFLIAGIRIDYEIIKNVNATIGIENIFDTYYYYHTSINDLPSLGRNFYIRLDYNFNN